MTHFNLSIKSACSEKWDSFQKDGNVGFCSSCQKNVVDFTKYSDQELIEFFKKNNGSSCGRFRVSQLKTYTLPKKKRDFSTVFAFITAGILTISNPPESKAQTTTSEITGQVMALEDSSKLPGVDVFIKETGERVATDRDGNFSLAYDGSQSKIVLAFNYLGFHSLEQEVVISNRATNIGTTYLEMMVLGGIDVVCIKPWYSPRRWWMGIKNIFN